MTLRLTPEGANIGGSASALSSETLSARGLLPYAPVQMRMRRVTGGIEFYFLRRTRFDGDSWDLLEVPLNETQELYELEILSGSIVKRTLSATQSPFYYSNESEIIDFGSAQISHHLKLYQVSATMGRGLVNESICSP